MNNKEKIRKYIEGELSGDELIKFDKEINDSPELKKEIDSLRNILNQFKNLNNINVDEHYFANILPRFRETTSKKKHLNFRPAFTFGSSAIFFVALILLFINLNKEHLTENEQLTLQQLDNEELNTFLNNYSDDLNTPQMTENISDEDDSLFSSMIADELSFNGYTGEYLVDLSSNEFYNILDGLTEEELVGIYNSLIMEDFN